MLLTVLSRTLDLAGKRFSTLFAAGWGYMALLLALNVAISVSLAPEAGFTTGSYMMEPIDQGADNAGREASLRTLALLANLVAGFSIGVAYLRRVLLGRREFFLAFGARNLRVAWKLAVLSVFGFLFLVPLMTISAMLIPITGPIGVFAMVASPFIALMLVQRISLVVPGAALDDAMTFKESWQLTRGIGWALAVAALALSVLSGIGIAVWGVVISLADLVVTESGPLAHLRSALFPMGAMVIVTWMFGSLHATAYALARERFIEEAGLRQAEVAEAEARRRMDQRHEARRAVDAVRSRGDRQR